MKPNILIVMTDQMRSTALGCAGVEKVMTPTLDAFAEEGTRFTNAISNTPACTPARATMLTGKHALRHGLVTNDMTLNREHCTLADCLKDAGYRCSYIGKLHVDGNNRGAYIPRGPRRLGFDDVWFGVECNHKYFQGYYYPDVEEGAPDPEPIWYECYEPHGQTEQALEFLNDQKDKEDPFCLVLSWGPPHCPYNDVPKRYKDMYPIDEIELMPTARDSGFNFESDDVDAAKRNIVSGYYAHVTALDDCFARVLEGLETNGLDENTIVVFMSDHGDMLFNHDQGWKCKPWRESVGVPLIVRWPNHIPSRRVSNTPIGLVDLMPTLLGMCGVDAPDDVNGDDLSAFMTGQGDATPECQFINFPCMNKNWTLPGWRGVVTERYTYAATPDGPWLLFDDLEDPFQQTNLIDDESLAEVRAHLQSLLKEKLDETGDNFDTQDEIAARFIPQYPQCVVPIPPLPDNVKNGQDERADRKY